MLILSSKLGSQLFWVQTYFYLSLLARRKFDDLVWSFKSQMGTSIYLYLQKWFLTTQYYEILHTRHLNKIKTI